MELTAENVVNTLKQCLFETTPEDVSKAVVVQGILRKFGFDPESLKTQEANITSMLEQLPEAFHSDKGGGYSFLAACNREDGAQWTGLHQTMDELFCLGMAINKVKPCMPRDVWALLPGGMPYYVVTL